MASWEDLDPAFVLPGHIEDTWRALYEVLVARVRIETEHLPIPTLVQLQIERNLAIYVEMRQAEAAPAGEAGGFLTPEARRDMLKLWLDITKDLNNMVFKVKASDMARAREEVMSRIAPQLAKFLNKLPADKREGYRKDLVELLEAVGT